MRASSNCIVFEDCRGFKVLGIQESHLERSVGSNPGNLPSYELFFHAL